MDIDLRSFPESGFERFFHLCSNVVRFDDRRIGVDFDVHVDDDLEHSFELVKNCLHKNVYGVKDGLTR